MLYAREQLSHPLFEEMQPLLYAHWKEIAKYQDILLEPDLDQYLKIQELGALRTFTARTDTGSLVGYAVFIVKNNLHYKSSLQAVQDILFISKDARGFGRFFIAWCDEELKSDGVQAVYHHVKTAHNFGPLLERLGYEHVEQIYSRRLD